MRLIALVLHSAVGQVIADGVAEGVSFWESQMESRKRKREDIPVFSNSWSPRGVIRAVHEHLDDLRNSERKVAQYVLEAADKVIYQSISELAENAATSEPTVLRFCRALGFKG